MSVYLCVCIYVFVFMFVDSTVKSNDLKRSNNNQDTLQGNPPMEGFNLLYAELSFKMQQVSVIMVY